jgi:hypothetical protein
MIDDPRADLVEDSFDGFDNGAATELHGIVRRRSEVEVVTGAR